MVRSMTGFGRCEITDADRKFTVELKSVNHRYLDVNIRMPKKFNFFETEIRKLLKNYAQRGKIDLFITYEDGSQNQAAVKYNAAMAKEYLEYMQQMADEFSLENDIRVSSLSRYPEVFTMEEASVDEEALWSGLKKALEGAFAQFADTREKEGRNLKADILGKLDHMLELIDAVELRSPKIITEYRAKLEEKVKELLEDTQIEESRLAAEVILFADKICTDEETVRLRSHVKHMNGIFESEEEGTGRKLDFIAQEMNREANTVLSKANDIEISNIAIDLKTEIEKIREQIQNIE